jgi:predicted MPP superfamily phosphohydrolase
MDAATTNLLAEAQAVFREEGTLIDLPPEGTLVCVGDTHGDLEATQKVLDRFLKPGFLLLFLGDYVDRGTHSREVITLLLRTKLEHPDHIFLLQGNHEGWKAGAFSPCNFWESLDPEEERSFADALAELPLMAHAENGLIASHGALPDVQSLEDIRRIRFSDERWRQITWGDWQDLPGKEIGDLGGRPQFGRDYFENIMQRFGKTVLIRSHQPHVPERLYDDRCLTVFTSRFYGVQRRVGLLDLEKTLRSCADIRVEQL